MVYTANSVAISLFFAVIALTLAITYWAARRSHTTLELYAAGGRITAGQNGLAIVGDLCSAALFLGSIGMYFTSGYDAVLYFFPAMTGFIVMLGFVAGPMRKLGRFTFADAAVSRLSPIPIRILAAVSTLAITLLYLTAQMIGAGALIQVLFGIPYNAAVVIVGGLIVTYVALGGMLATTWVQIIKAGLMFAALLLMALLALGETGFRLDELYARAATVHKLGIGLFQPGGLGLTPSQTFSLALGLALGIAGMPHILMRFFTVPSPAVARKSLVIAMGLMAILYTVLLVVLGPAAAAFVTGNPEFMTEAGAPRGGSNMVALHLAAYLGGNVLVGIVAAVAFATILAVVSGLTVAAASAVSHDLVANVFGRGKISDRQEAIVFRASALAIGALGVFLGVAFEGLNIMYLIGMLFSIAASATFPVLVMAMHWDRLTTTGAVAGGAVGLILSLGLIIVSPSVWVQVLGNPEAILQMDQPAIISVPSAFAVMIVVSLLTTERTSSATSPQQATK
jgi:cation/acetate symporter